MHRLPLFLLLLCTAMAKAQFKNDNVKYTTVYPEDLCKTLQANPGYTLLDVRSQGEFDDTLSSAPGLNIGRIKDALHISIQELPQRWKELLSYKDKPLFIYCSHSQRSRRASRMLADSGFTKLFNVDGGLTNFYVQGIAQNKCGSYSIVSNLSYKIISPKQLADNSKSVNYFILDVRADSSFNSISRSAEANLFGHFNDAVNIPFEKLGTSFSSIPTDKPVLIVDEYGSESAKAAKLLNDKGYKEVSILINGMDEWLDYVAETGNKQGPKWKQNVHYKIISAEEFEKLVNNKKDFQLIDARSANEFKNASKNYWENIGNIQGATNIPASDIAASSQLPSSKNKAIILYGFNNQDAVYAAAEQLTKQGYTDVSVLRGGIWNLRWSSHNIKGKERLNKLVENVPEQNL